MDATLIKGLQLVLSLSILVVLHEGGHFFFSKLFRVKVEKFFLFFDPYFHLFSTKDKWFTRLFPKCKGNETEYGVGWLPFGGYVKIAGMIDESMDTEQMKKPVQPWEFRAKPAWQRLLIMVGGVLVNFLLALFIYTMVLFHWGEEYIPAKDMTMGYQFNEQAEKLGFRDNDVILAVDGKEIKKWDGSVYRAVSEAKQVTVLRHGRTRVLHMPGDINMLEMLKAYPPFMVPYVPAVVDSVVPASPAWEAGMRDGDRVLAVNGVEIETWTDFDGVMQAYMDSAKAFSPAADSTVLAGGIKEMADSAVLADGERKVADSMSLRKLTVAYMSSLDGAADTVVMTLTEDFKLGVVKRSLLSYYEPVKVEYGFWASIPAGVSHGIEVLSGYVSDLQYLFTADGAKSVGSFITIGSIFPATWDWLTFWETTAFLSLMLAFMNILPIPALDGGHVLFLIAEIILRRPPSEKFLERAQVVGMTLLIGLMVLACYNDIVRFLL